MEFLTQLFPQLSSGPMIKVFGTLLILVFGHLLVKAVRLGIERFYSRQEELQTIIELKEERVDLLTNLLDVGIIIIALWYLNVGLGTKVQSVIVQQAPRIFSVMLIAVLGLLLINIIDKVLRDFFKTLGLKTYLREAGMSSATFNVISIAVKFFLYLGLAQIILYQLKLNIVVINQLLNAFSWAFAFLVAALLFYSSKDVFQNIGAGFYLKNSRIVRAGERITVNNDSGEVKEVSLFGTTMETKDGYTVFKPNKEVIDSGIKFKRAKSDLETLENIVECFEVSDPELGRAASVRMALEFLGEETSVESLEEKLKEKKVDQVVAELTDSSVKAAEIESRQIHNLEDELKAWFNDGAIAVLDFDKKKLFPNSEPGRNVVSIGVEDGDILNLDLVESSSGSVYYIAADRLEELMDNGSFLFLAPEGTTAYWRIKKDLIFGDKSLYENISKTHENKLKKIMRQGEMLDEVSPDSVQRYLETWRRQETESSLWTPNGRENSESTSSN